MATTSMTAARSTYGFRILLALQGKPMYEGTVPDAVKARRRAANKRAANKRARAARRANR